MHGGTFTGSRECVVSEFGELTKVTVKLVLGERLQSELAVWKSIKIVDGGKKISHINEEKVTEK